MKKIFLFFLLPLVLVFWGAVVWADVPTPRGDGREELIARELNAVARRGNFDSQSSIETEQLLDVSSQSIKEAKKPVVSDFQDDVQIDEPQTDTDRTDNRIDRERLKKIELALQMASYNYKTDHNFPYYYSFNYDTSNQVEKSGGLVGSYASYTYRKISQDPVHNFMDLMQIEESPFFTFARLEGEFAFGNVEYDSYVTGKLRNADIWQGNIRVLAGYDFLSLDETFMATPYIGFGYRQVEDDTGGWVDISLDAHGFYKNTYRYYYLPLGIETLKRVNSDWDIGFKFEGSYLLFGDVQFALSEIEGTFPGTDFSTGLPIETYFRDSPKMKVRQGFGFKTSFKTIKKLRFYNVFFEPFFEFWRIANTESKVRLAYGTNGTNYYSVYGDGSEYKPLFEPQNVTVSFGLRLGVQF